MRAQRAPLRLTVSPARLCRVVYAGFLAVRWRLTDFSPSDVTEVGGTLSNFAGSGTVYTATFTGAANTDITNASISVTSGSYHDAVGNSGGRGTVSFNVDTITPTVASVGSSQGTFQTGNLIAITLTMSEAVTVSGGTPTLTVNGGTATYDALQSTATALVFDYTVRASDRGSTLAITNVSQNGAVVKESAGNTADLSGALTTLLGTYLNVPTNGNNTVVTGNNSNVVLRNGADNVTAGQNSTISVGNGIDTVSAGANSTISAGNGNDTVSAGKNSIVRFGNGNDSVTAGAGSTVSLGNGNDTVNAGANSTVTVGDGTDIIFAGPNDLINLGKGYDTVAFGESPSPLA
jgi:hypothetical protein